jgi:hypothetical protein
VGAGAEGENDREFAEIIRAIANRRKTDRSVQRFPPTRIFYDDDWETPAAMRALLLNDGIW